jgi:hypothetical protein
MFVWMSITIGAPVLQESNSLREHREVGTWVLSNDSPGTCVARTDLLDSVVAIRHTSHGKGAWTFNISSPKWSALRARDGETIGVSVSFETDRLVGVFADHFEGKVLSIGGTPSGVAYSLQNAAHAAHWYTANGITVEAEGIAVHVGLAPENASMLQNLIRCSNGQMRLHAEVPPGDATSTGSPRGI